MGGPVLSRGGGGEKAPGLERAVRGKRACSPDGGSLMPRENSHDLPRPGADGSVGPTGATWVPSPGYLNLGRGVGLAVGVGSQGRG